MNLLIFSRYTSSQASTRVRFLQFIPYFKEKGINVDLFSLLSNNSINIKNNILRICFFRLIDFARTLKKLASIRNEDVVHIHIELFPWLPFLLENLILRMFGIRNYSIEYDDAWFHRYDRHPNLFLRLLYQNKIAQLMARAQLVIAGNEYISDYAKLAGSKLVAIIPTVIDFKKYDLRKRKNEIRLVPVVGWIGTPATTKFLLEIQSVIRYLHDKEIANFHAFGADESQLLSLPIKVIPWDENIEISTLYEFDIGIMPLHDSWFERGKCGYKLIQYMACGIPVVASPVGVNNNIVLSNVNGFLARSETEWIDSLTALCLDEALRIKLGLAGRRLGLESYSTTTVQFKLANLFKNLKTYNCNEKSR